MNCLTRDKAISFDQCIVWARLRFEEYFNNNIQQLLFNFPKDAVTSSGATFWSGPKRAPEPLQFNVEEVGWKTTLFHILFSLYIWSLLLPPLNYMPLTMV